MADDGAKVRQGPPVAGQQLPEGGAKQVNEADAQAQQAINQQPQPGAEEAPQEAAPEEQAPMPETAPRPTGGMGDLPGEEDQMLFGPTSRPYEPIKTGVGRPPQAPGNVGAWLPALQQAAADPDAPDNVKQLLGLVTMILQRNG